MGFFSKDIKNMGDLFVHTLRDIYYAENRITKALPKMIEKATHPQLKQGFEQHLAQTKTHVTRVEEVFKMHGVEAASVTCPAIDGIIKGQTDAALTVATTTEVLTVPRSEVARVKTSDVSMMPEGLLSGMSDKEVRELIAYLRGPSQVALPTK